MPRPLNPKWEQAARIARAMHNDTAQNVKRLMKEFNLVEKEGYSKDLAEACWYWLIETQDFLIGKARITTVLTGSPVWIEQFREAVVEGMPPNMPAVYESAAHDDFVYDHGEILKLLGFIYRVENQPGRLTTEQLIKCGLKGAE